MNDEVRKDLFDVLQAVSGHHRIIGFRNILIHGYDTVDDTIVWGAISGHLPTLISEIQELLEA